MADGTFNIAKGAIKAYYNNVKSNSPANSALVLVMLQASQADDDLNNYDDLATLLAHASNTEANFTNYARKVLTDADLAALPAPDDTNNYITLDLPDWAIASAGGAINNTMTKILVCYDPDTTGGTDSDIIPLTHQDYTETTSGGNIQANTHADGWYRCQ